MEWLIPYHVNEDQPSRPSSGFLELVSDFVSWLVEGSAAGAAVAGAYGGDLGSASPRATGNTLITALSSSRPRPAAEAVANNW